MLEIRLPENITKLLTAEGAFERLIFNFPGFVNSSVCYDSLWHYYNVQIPTINSRRWFIHRVSRFLSHLWQLQLNLTHQPSYTEEHDPRLLLQKF